MREPVDYDLVFDRWWGTQTSVVGRNGVELEGKGWRRVVARGAGGADECKAVRQKEAQGWVETKEVC